MAVGDHTTRREADKLAALAAVFELHGRGLVRPQILCSVRVVHVTSVVLFYE